jgi:hypothetical protein
MPTVRTTILPAVALPLPGAVVIPAPGRKILLLVPPGFGRGLGNPACRRDLSCQRGRETCPLAGAFGVGIVRCDTDEARPVDDVSPSPG